MEAFQTALSDLFAKLGENPNREGLKKTPERMIQMYKSFIKENKDSSNQLLGTPLHIDAKADQESILINQIPFCALCEHHLVPFFGNVHIAYVPNRHIIGLGRVFQYIESISRRLVLQENLSAEISLALFSHLQAKALLVKMSGLHTCLTISQKATRGIQLTTHSFRGDKSLQTLLMSQTHEYN